MPDVCEAVCAVDALGVVVVLPGLVAFDGVGESLNPETMLLDRPGRRVGFVAATATLVGLAGALELGLVAGFGSAFAMGF